MAGYHGVTADELEDLKARGFIEGQPNTIPENLSPVLKSKLLQAMGYPGDGSSPNAGDLNPTDGQQTALAKEDDKGKKQDATKAKKK